MAVTCELCRQPSTRENPLNRHHYQGKKNDRKKIMRVHSKTCHLFADWITNLYIQSGKEQELEAKHIVYMFNRVAAIRDDEVCVLPIYGRKL